MKKFVLEHHNMLKKCRETLPHNPEVRIIFKTLKEAVIYAKTITPINSYINWNSLPRYIVMEGETVIRSGK